MDRERRRQVERLYRSALALDPGPRKEFLARACAGDAELLQEVEFLLAEGVPTAPAEPAPVEKATAQSPTPAAAPASVGRIGPYLILGELGRGGMGKVYRARDTRLGREVAIKISADRFSGRFKHEARAISALNHPHICSLHDIGEQDGAEYLVMEYVDGETLAAILKQRQLTISEALLYGLQIADALRAAHARGIVHRDLKPANIMVTSAGIKILDFGLAKVAESAAPRDAEFQLTETVQTQAGEIVGTVAYMSPEQAEGQPVDPRSDLFSLGALLYEMLCGRRPFIGNSPMSTVAAILQSTPEPLHQIRREIPVELERIVSRCLEKKPDARFQTADELARELARFRTGSPAGARRWLLAAAAVVALSIVAAFGIRWFLHTRRARWAEREAMPEIVRLMAARRPLAALRLLRKAEPYAAATAELVHLKEQLIPTGPFSIDTVPSGADIYVREYLDSSDQSRWELLGRSPLRVDRLAIGQYRWRALKKGWEPVERAWSVFLNGGNLRMELHTAADTPPGMVWVAEAPPGSGFVLGALPAVALPAFWMDRYEVTNRQFKEFVAGGGYQKRRFWKQPFVKDGQTLAWEEAMAQFKDATGKPGPATWQLGTYPEGKDDFPVGGVSWYEAAAFAEFAGKSLPTVYHWWHAAGQWVVFSEMLRFSNFSGQGPAKVGALGGLAPFGNYDMAGNAKEWCSNPAGDRRYTLGGGWNEPTYQFMLLDARRPFDRADALGFRCVKYLTPVARSLDGPVPAGVTRDRRNDKPADDAAFSIYQGLHSYDKTDLRAKVESVDQSSPYWRREKATFQAAYGNERMLAHLYVPKNAAPPYQVVVYFGGAGFLTEPTIGQTAFEFFSFVVRSGRAVVVPAYKGTLERGPGAYYHLLGEPNRWREMNLQQSKDLGRTIDYLESRPDMDTSKLAFLGESLGAALAPHFVAMEPRFKTAILTSGGSFEKVPAEVDSWNFAPRVKIPVLMVNGRDDFRFPLESSQLPLFRALGTPEKDKKHVLYDGGHASILVHPEIMKEILEWLDRYLGQPKTTP